MQFPLSLRLRPSPTLMWAGGLAHIAVLGVCQFGLESAWLRVVCGILVAASLARFIADERGKRGRMLVLSETGAFGFGSESTMPVEARVKRVSDFRSALWIAWQSPDDERRVGRTHNLMLLPDHLGGGEEWRALKIWLRHKALRLNRDEVDAH